MRNKTLRLLLVILLALSLMLAACQTQPEVTQPEEPTTAPVEEEAPAEPTEEPTSVPEPTEAPTEEPTPEPEPTAEPEPASSEQVNAGFSDFLAGMEAYGTIDAETLNTLLVEDPPFVLDVRNPEELEENGWIPTAVNVPLMELPENLDKLPSQDTTVVGYCGSGWRCTIAMSLLEMAGWENVLSLTGGSFAGWTEAGYEIEEGTPPEAEVLDAAEVDPGMVLAMRQALDNIPGRFGIITPDDLNTALIENPDLILIDVRRVEEVEENGYIDAENVLFIPLEELVARQDEWPEDTGAPIVVYCGSGHRSTIGMTILAANGYEDVHSMQTGFRGWAEAGYPVAGNTQATVDANFQTFLDGMEAYGTIDAETLNTLLVEDPPFVLDVRNPEELEENGWIPTAVNVPLMELPENLDKLPSQDTTIVGYCGSGWRCTIAMTLLEMAGWENVLSLTGGSFGGWAEAGYEIEEGTPPEAEALDAAEVDPALVEVMRNALDRLPDRFGIITPEDLNTELVENPDLILIDVRRDDEVAEQGVIDAPNLIHIPLEELIVRQDEWPEDTGAPIVVYCGSGHRSTIGMTILAAHGYENVRSLQTGFRGWAEAGFPTREAEMEAESMGGEANLDEAFATFLADMEGYGVISLEDANTALIEDPPPFLLDVREVGEAEEKGHIESAVLIPLRELAQNIDYLPSFDTPIITYCGSGWRATIAMTALEAMGWENVQVLRDGSFSGWVEAGYPVAEGLPPEPLLLEVAEPDPAIVAEIDQMLQNLPEGWGTIAVDDLNTELIENPDLVLVDVRRDEEVAEQGVIDAPNLIHVPLEQFIERMDEWPAAEEEIVVYCGSGHRSTIGMSILRSYGYENVRSLVGGFSEWAEAGYPVTELATP